MAKKNVIVDGIKVSIDTDVFEDFEVLEIFAEMQEPLPNEDSEEYNKVIVERGKVAIKLVNLLLGNQKETVIKAIKERNNGVCKTEQMFEFISKLVESSTTAKK